MKKTVGLILALVLILSAVTASALVLNLGSSGAKRGQHRNGCEQPSIQAEGLGIL